MVTEYLKLVSDVIVIVEDVDLSEDELFIRGEEVVVGRG
jgi:hypothetical protein